MSCCATIYMQICMKLELKCAIIVTLIDPAQVAVIVTQNQGLQFLGLLMCRARYGNLWVEQKTNAIYVFSIVVGFFITQFY